MKNLKDVLTTALGWAGYLLWCIITSLLTFAPIWMLDFPFWFSFIAIAVYFILPFSGSFMMFILWMWSFAVSFIHPFGFFSIFYYVSAVIYLVLYFPPFISVAANFIAPRPKHYFWDNAPMKYYNFLVYFGLIFSIIASIVNTYSSYQNYTYFSWAVDLFIISITGYAWIKLKRREWSGAVAICLINLFKSILFTVLAIFLLTVSVEPAETIVNAIASWIVCIALWVYFRKRRPLFSPYDQYEGDASYYESSMGLSDSSCDDSIPELKLDLDEADSQSISNQKNNTSNIRQKSRISPMIVVLSLVCLLLIVVSVCSILYAVQRNSEYEELKKDLEYDEKQIEQLQQSNSRLIATRNSILSERNKLKDAFSYYYNNIGFMIEEDSLYYHSFECPVLENFDSYLAGDIEICEALGYSKCPYCYSWTD